MFVLFSAGVHKLYTHTKLAQLKSAQLSLAYIFSQV